jgi:hypothetical protein
MCRLRFDFEENTIIETYVRFRFDIVVITTPLVSQRMKYKASLDNGCFGSLLLLHIDK